LKKQGVAKQFAAPADFSSGASLLLRWLFLGRGLFGRFL